MASLAPFTKVARTFLQSTDMERLCQRGILVDSLVRRENYFLEGALRTRALTTLESQSRVGYRFQDRSEARKVGASQLRKPMPDKYAI